MTAPKRILVVDHDPDVHRVLQATLEAPNRQIDHAYEVPSALERVETEVYDLVLVDLNLSAPDGPGLVEKIRKRRLAAQIVVLSDGGSPECVLKALRHRAFACLRKPLTPCAVAEMVSNALHDPAPEDDIEVVSALPNWLSVRLRCRMQTADRLLHFLNELGADLPPAERDNIVAAVREILVNAIEHGCRSDPAKKVSITYLDRKSVV